MKKRKVIVLAAILISVFSSQALAQANDFDMLVVNSGDWVDVYSAVMYANLIGKPFNFISSREQSTRLPSMLSGERIYLIESEKLPFVTGYKSTLEGKGFTVEERTSGGGKSLNLGLARDLNTNKFIIIDDAYGYNAVSVCPYAVASRSYVLFADRENVDDVYNLLKDKNPEILVYGHLDEEVIDRLDEFRPEVIDYGDKFDDNIEIVGKYRSIKPVEQVTLSSGDFMEVGLMRGVEPILFIGRGSVPEQVVEYVKNSKIKVGVLVGNELIKSAQSLKANTGISIFLKFGQGSGSGAGSASIRDLDLIYLPSHQLNITIDDIAFNVINNELEVIYKNEVNTFSYFKSSINVYVDDELVQTAGEKEPVLIDAGEKQGLTYPVDLSGYDLKTSNLKADVFLQYGGSRKSMERVFEGALDIKLVEIRDLSDIEIAGLSYDRDRQRLNLEIRNKGTPCYVEPALTLVVEGDKTTLGGSDTYQVNEKATRNINFNIELSGEDLEANENIQVSVLYGERENFLTKNITTEISLKVEGGEDSSTLFYPAIIIVMLTVIIVLLVLVLRKRDRGEEERRADEE